jgi:hypothetical protein
MEDDRQLFRLRLRSRCSPAREGPEPNSSESNPSGFAQLQAERFLFLAQRHGQAELEKRRQLTEPPKNFRGSHFHVPKDEEEANAWLMNFLVRYNAMEHRSEPHSRMEDWLENLPASGVRATCSWERFCTFAREPERRKVGSEARVSVAGVNYEVDPDLVGETVILWWGIFDNELYVEHGDKRFGPYAPMGGPIPLYRYRTFKKFPTQQRADRIEALAEQLALPRAALEGNPRVALLIRNTEVSLTTFTDPDPFQEFAYSNVLAAKRARE